MATLIVGDEDLEFRRMMDYIYNTSASVYEEGVGPDLNTTVSYLNDIQFLEYITQACSLTGYARRMKLLEAAVYVLYVRLQPHVIQLICSSIFMENIPIISVNRERRDDIPNTTIIINLIGGGLKHILGNMYRTSVVVEDWTEEGRRMWQEEVRLFPQYSAVWATRLERVISVEPVIRISEETHSYVREFAASLTDISTMFTSCTLENVRDLHREISICAIEFMSALLLCREAMRPTNPRQLNAITVARFTYAPIWKSVVVYGAQSDQRDDPHDFTRLFLSGTQKMIGDLFGRWAKIPLILQSGGLLRFVRYDMAQSGLTAYYATRAAITALMTYNLLKSPFFYSHLDEISTLPIVKMETEYRRRVPLGNDITPAIALGRVYGQLYATQARGNYNALLDKLEKMDPWRGVMTEHLREFVKARGLSLKMHRRMTGDKQARWALDDVAEASRQNMVPTDVLKEARKAYSRMSTVDNDFRRLAITYYKGLNGLRPNIRDRDYAMLYGAHIHWERYKEVVIDRYNDQDLDIVNDIQSHNNADIMRALMKIILGSSYNAIYKSEVLARVGEEGEEGEEEGEISGREMGGEEEEGEILGREIGRVEEEEEEGEGYDPIREHRDQAQNVHEVRERIEKIRSMEAEWSMAHDVNVMMDQEGDDDWLDCLKSNDVLSITEVDYEMYATDMLAAARVADTGLGKGAGRKKNMFDGRDFTSYLNREFAISADTQITGVLVDWMNACSMSDFPEFSQLYALVKLHRIGGYVRGQHASIPLRDPLWNNEHFINTYLMLVSMDDFDTASFLGSRIQSASEISIIGPPDEMFADEGGMGQVPGHNIRLPDQIPVPKHRGDFEIFCKNVAKAVYIARALRPDENYTARVAKMAYHTYRSRRVVMRWFVDQCFKSYYNIGLLENDRAFLYCNVDTYNDLAFSTMTRSIQHAISHIDDTERSILDLMRRTQTVHESPTALPYSENMPLAHPRNYTVHASDMGQLLVHRPLTVGIRVQYLEDPTILKYFRSAFLDSFFLHMSSMDKRIFGNYMQSRAVPRTMYSKIIEFDASLMVSHAREIADAVGYLSNAFVTKTMRDYNGIMEGLWMLVKAMVASSLFGQNAISKESLDAIYEKGGLDAARDDSNISAYAASTSMHSVGTYRASQMSKIKSKHQILRNNVYSLVKALMVAFAPSQTEQTTQVLILKWLLGGAFMNTHPHRSYTLEDIYKAIVEAGTVYKQMAASERFMTEIKSIVSDDQFFNVAFNDTATPSLLLHLAVLSNMDFEANILRPVSRNAARDQFQANVFTIFRKNTLFSVWLQEKPVGEFEHYLYTAATRSSKIIKRRSTDGAHGIIAVPRINKEAGDGLRNKLLQMLAQIALPAKHSIGDV